MDEKAATGKPENGSTLTHAEELTIGERVLQTCKLIPLNGR